MKKLFVTGTDTGVGKTWISTILIPLFRDAGYQTGAYKPVCSGAEFPEAAAGVLVAQSAPRWGDLDLLRAACMGSPFPVGEPSEQLVCPQRFLAPLAPPEAARVENTSVNCELLREGLHAWQGQADLVVVEGAGGLLSPLSDTDTLADLAAEFQGPLVIVAGNRLGVINHTLLTVEVAQRRGLRIAAVIVNDVRPASESSDLSVTSNLRLLQKWLPGTHLFKCRWGSRQLESASHTAEKAPVQALLEYL